jgi:hypothetical protein
MFKLARQRSLQARFREMRQVLQKVTSIKTHKPTMSSVVRSPSARQQTFK